jgi:hypothetical protein
MISQNRNKAKSCKAKRKIQIEMVQNKSVDCVIVGTED